MMDFTVPGGGVSLLLVGVAVEADGTEGKAEASELGSMNRMLSRAFHLMSTG